MPDHPSPPSGWEFCPDCQNYFQGSHICDQTREALLARVEGKLDRIIALLEQQAAGNLAISYGGTD